MRNRKIIVMLAGAMLLLAGCIKEELPAPPRSSADGTMRIALSIGDADLITTRSEASANECKINDAFLLVFGPGESGTYKDGERVNLDKQIEFKNNNVKTPVITTKLTIESGDRVVVLLNTGIGVVPPGLKVGETTAKQINGLFPTTGWNLNPSDAAVFGQGLPMSGEMTYAPKSDGSGEFTCEIKRAVAKIQLQVDIKTDTTALVSPDKVKWAMYNVLGPTKGALFSPDGKVTAIEGLAASDFSQGVLDRTDLTQGQIYTQAYYMPEYPSATRAKEKTVTATQFSADRTCMIVEVEEDKAQDFYRYYRIDLYDHVKKQFIDVCRNTHILVTITNVKSSGYLTVQDALENPGGNLEYDIKVSGENDNVVISNGQYALSLEYDELIGFVEPNTEYTLGKVSFIDIAGAGVPTMNAIVSIEKAGKALIEVTGAATVTKEPQDIKLKFTKEAFNYGYVYVDIKLGTIRKRIFIFLAHLFQCNAIEDMTYQPYHDCADVHWVRKEEGIDIVALPNPNLVGGARNLQVTCTDNIIPENALEMSDPAAVPIFRKKLAECYFMRDKDQKTGPGRTKVIVAQDAPEYIGWFGGTPDNSGPGRYSKRLVSYSTETDSYYFWAPGHLPYVGATNAEFGLANTNLVVGQADPLSYLSFRECLLLNDVNGDSKISADEPVNWYLPARNQMMSMWVVKEALKIPFTSTTYYWTSTEMTESRSWMASMNDGYLSYWEKINQLKSRCVRDM